MFLKHPCTITSHDQVLLLSHSFTLLKTVIAYCFIRFGHRTLLKMAKYKQARLGNFLLGNVKICKREKTET